MGRSEALRAAALLYAVGLALHTADHFRRGTDAVTPQVLWLGTAGTVLGIVAIAAVLVGHRMAPEIAAAVGLPKAIGVSAVHFLPAWGAFSDSFVTGDVDALSWAAASIETIGAFALGIVGVRALTRRSRVTDPGSTRNSATDPPTVRLGRTITSEDARSLDDGR